MGLENEIRTLPSEPILSILAVGCSILEIFPDCSAANLSLSSFSRFFFNYAAYLRPIDSSIACVSLAALVSLTSMISRVIVKTSLLFLSASSSCTFIGYVPILSAYVTLASIDNCNASLS